ncbi:MAG: hypothetical protein SOW08_05640 [Lachnospiraceae bacterium]|nr:hypothetical protein [Lachnospiraceae bacterium]
MIFEMLPEGKTKAISKEILCAELNIDARTLRSYILRERQSGFVILSNTRTGGYYKPATESELDEYIQMQKSQIFSRFRSIRSAQKMKQELAEKQSGQLTLTLSQEE